MPVLTRLVIGTDLRVGFVQELYLTRPARVAHQVTCTQAAWPVPSICRRAWCETVRLAGHLVAVLLSGFESAVTRTRDEDSSVEQE
jgi:hypothetical protein